MIKPFIICIWLLTFVDGLSIVGEIFHLSIVHINDFHASFEETNKWGKQCKNQQQCIGGFTRMYETIMSLKKNNPNALILNAGDNFQGTIWYSVFGKNVTLHFLNKIPFDALTLGNHEFDDAVTGAVDFIKLSTAPIVLANVNDSLEPEFQKLYKKSIVVERNGRKIGIIGVLLTETREKSQVGKLIFLDESESINKEAERLVREENVFTNIVVSHSGYGLEVEMARKATGRISVIVGGHTHSLLWSGDITFRQILAALPFKNNIVAGYIKGKFLLDALEHALHYFAEWQSRLLQVSGIKITYNMSMPEGKRLISAEARCMHCEVPRYTDIRPDVSYKIVLQHFIAQGGDGFIMFRDNLTVTRRGGLDVEALVNFLSRKSPVWEEVCDRITILEDENIPSLYRK